MSIEDLQQQVASKMDAAQLLDFLDISMDDLVILLEDYLVERKEELILALED